MEDIVILIIIVVWCIICAKGYHIQKQREEVGFLEIGKNHKLFFDQNIKAYNHKVILDTDLFRAIMSNFAGVKYKTPEINYWYWINENGEKIGTTFLIREEDAFQFEMNYSEFLKIKNEILEISEEQNFEKALKKYFQEASKSVKLIACQFEKLLTKRNINYEKIVGI